MAQIVCDAVDYPSSSDCSSQIEEFMKKLIARNPGELEFHQAVHEVVETVMPVVQANPAYRKAKILERMIEPERVIMFRVPWVDDQGEVQINRGYRVQMNSASALTRAEYASTPR